MKGTRRNLLLLFSLCSMRTLALLSCLLFLSVLEGCASIMHGTSQEMTFQSSPEEATVTVVGRVIGKTPVTSRLDKKSGQSVVFSKDGYKPVTMELATTMDSWFWGNIVLGGFIGSTTDGLSGAVHEYSPSQYFVTLTPDGVSNIENLTLKSQRDKAKEFIVGHYTNLMDNISKGSGEDFSALMGLLNIGKDQEAEALRKIRSLSEVYTDAPAFANQVTALYLTSPATPPASQTPLSDSTTPKTQKLRELQNLRNDGIITEDEFQKKKLQLLEEF